MQVPASIKDRVEQKLRESIALAEAHFNQKFSFPTILYAQRGRTAGTARVREWSVNFNAVLLMENVDDFIARTVPHEMAHLIDFQLHPENFESDVRLTWNGRYKRTKRSVHGQTWKRIMMILGAPTSRCHRYDTSNSTVRKSNKFVWVCDQHPEITMKLGPKQHKQQKMYSTNDRSYYMPRGHGLRRGVHTFSFSHQEGQKPVQLLAAAANAASHEHPTTMPLPPTASSKLEQCRALYKQHRGASRQGMIELFVRHAGCTNAGAATYYAKIKKEIN